MFIAVIISVVSIVVSTIVSFLFYILNGINKSIDEIKSQKIPERLIKIETKQDSIFETLRKIEEKQEKLSSALQEIKINQNQVGSIGISTSRIISAVENLPKTAPKNNKKQIEN